MKPVHSMAMAAALAAVLAGTLPAAALDLAIAPGPTVLRGDPVSITVSGVAPGTRVEITASRVLSGRRPGAFAGSAVFIADDAGRIDTGSMAPAEGSYDGADEAGLFWSMTRIEGEVPEDADPQTITIRARAADGSESAATLTLRNAVPGLVEMPVPGFPGAILYRIADEAQRPALIVLGGSEGGAAYAREMGPALASRGYAVLGLPYYAPDWGGGREIPDLPPAFIGIPVDRLSAARDWLAAQPGIAAARVGVIGVSKGAEFALIAASRFDWIAATVAIVPSDVVWEGWGPGSRGPGRESSFSWAGEALAFVPYGDADLYFGAFERGERPQITLADVHARGRAANPGAVAAARIKVEAIAGALLVAGGGQDTIWPSAEMTRAIVSTRRAAGLETVAIVDEDAGHGLSGQGFMPTGEYGSGGTPAANGRAQVAIWRATLALFGDALNPPPVPPAGG